MDRDNKEQVMKLLCTYIQKETTVVVGVSGGPDSMFLATCLQEYYTQKGRDQKDICVAHYNHGQRKASKNEYLFLKKHFQYNTFYWNSEIPPLGLSETKLRTSRHEFFIDVLTQSKSTHLFLGHNLTDRIETSIINMVRGSSKDGILGIKPIHKKQSYTIYRPLLGLTKNAITHTCDTYNIPYFVDTTNNKSITPRNIIRNTIFPQIQALHPGGKEHRITSREKLYQLIDKQPQKSLTWTKHTPHQFRGAKNWFSATIKDIDDDMIMTLFKDTYYATTKTLQVIQSFIHNASGHLFVGGWYIFKTTTHIHCIDGSKDFWKQKYPHSWTISQHGNMNINGYIYDIKKQRVGCVLRYPQSGDTYKKKRLLKVLLNRKVPIFMRNITPVVVSQGSIISLLDTHVSSSNLR